MSEDAICIRIRGEHGSTFIWKPFRGDMPYISFSAGSFLWVVRVSDVVNYSGDNSAILVVKEWLLRRKDLVMTPVCEDHGPMCQTLGKIESFMKSQYDMLKDLTQKYEQHINDADKEGGWHDRIKVLEQAVIQGKKWEIPKLVVASLIGGLTALKTPLVFELVANFVRGFFGI